VTHIFGSGDSAVIDEESPQKQIDKSDDDDDDEMLVLSHP